MHERVVDVGCCGGTLGDGAQSSPGGSIVCGFDRCNNAVATAESSVDT